MLLIRHFHTAKLFTPYSETGVGNDVLTAEFTAETWRGAAHRPKPSGVHARQRGTGQTITGIIPDIIQLVEKRT